MRTPLSREQERIMWSNATDLWKSAKKLHDHMLRQNMDPRDPRWRAMLRAYLAAEQAARECGGVMGFR